ncbi:signal peptidase I [Microbacterium immunditiarum]|uniref:Signal peptidase I n=1 Tax=Microbacterium immunditiarum TaxID=337480 RepID=A0A7Y9KKM0_9MICO|nr:signal peptidase I [Microbacterium immunditiarum]NYE19328.1 signal peptidase I [Microbacterium immunditiarum]
MMSPRARRMRAAATLTATLLPFALGAAAVLSVGIARVENDSMSPTLATGDVLVFDRVAAPARGDIVIFADTAGWSERPGALLVKRVIGNAGDRVVCCEVGTGRLLVDGAPQDEPYETGDRPGGVVPFEVAVPEGAVWVMGDNRGASRDSRSGLHTPRRGAVPLEDVLGVVRFSWPGEGG